MSMWIEKWLSKHVLAELKRNESNQWHACKKSCCRNNSRLWWSTCWSSETRLTFYMCVEGVPMKVLGYPRFERHRGVLSMMLSKGRKHIWSFLCLFHRKSLRELAENALPTFTARGKQWRPASRSISRHWVNNIGHFNESLACYN